MKNLILILVFVTLFIACKKQHTVTIQAQNLTNLSDGSHYSGMKYIIVERRVGTFENKYKTVEEGFLDENGYANFDLKMHPNRTYDLGIETPENICYTDVTIKYHLDLNQNNVVNFKYAPCTYFDVSTNNVNCEGSTDKLWYKYYYTDNPDIYIYRGFTGVGDTVWDPNAGTQGCVNYIGDFYDKIPAGNYTFEWHIERPSGIVDGIDYFTVTEGDTTSYVLEY
ncbi:MAG: hypothetical protein ACWA41_00620 [Putridiphycobacter sp.]